MTRRRTVYGWAAGVVLALLASQAAAISLGDVWYAEEGMGLVLIASGDGTVLAQTSSFPADPMAIAVDPNDGSCWVAGKDGRVYHVATDGTHSVLADLSADPTGNVPPFDSIALAPAAVGGGLYVKSDKYGDWGLYRVLPDGSVPWAVSPGRTTGMHALAVDLLSGNAVCANYGDGSIGVQSYQDGSRLGGYATGTARLAQRIDVYQHDGSFWVEDTASPKKILHLRAGGGLYTDYYLCENVQDICIDQTDATVWLIIGTGTSAEVVHVAASGSPAAELARFGLGTLDEAKDLDIDYNSDLVWVADRRHRQVVKYDPNGVEADRYNGVNGKYIRAVAVYNPPVDLSGAQSTGRIYPDRTPLNTGSHPRLFLTDSDLPAIRTRITGDPWARWYGELKSEADAALADPIAPFPYNNWSGTWYARAQDAHYLAFVGLVENDTAYLDRARLCLVWKRWVGAADPWGAEMTASDIGMHCGLAYDMAYTVLTDADKIALEGDMEDMPQDGYSRLAAGGWGWGGNVGTKTGSGMGLISLAIGPTTTTWAQSYYNMCVATIEDGLSAAFDSDGFYDESQGYLATGWYNMLHTLLAMRKTGATDYWADARLIRWHKTLACTASPLGTILQFEDSSLTGGFMMMTTALPLAAGLMPATEAEAKSWAKSGYEATVANHPYQGPKYTVTTYDADMAICAVEESVWNGITATPPSPVLPARYPSGGAGSFVLRSGMEAADDIHLALNSRRQCGWPYSSHEHMDGGAIELTAYGTRLLVSPGYSDSGGLIADWQDATLAASTLIADRNNNGVFEIVADRQDGGWGGSGNGAMERAIGEQVGIAVGTYDYWYDNDPRFTRNVLFVGKAGGSAPYYVVIDDVDMVTTSRKAAPTWHCRGTLSVTDQQGEWTVPSDIGGDDVTLNVHVVKPEGLTISTGSGKYYPFFASAYTEFEETVPYLIAETSGASSYRYLTVLYPRQVAQALPSIAPLSGEHACTVGTDDLFFSQDEPYTTVTIEGVSTDAELGFVRKAGTGDLDGFIAKNGTSLDFAGAGFSASGAVTLCLMDLAGAIETYAAGVSVTVSDPDVPAGAVVRIDGDVVGSSGSAGTVTFSVAVAGHHTLVIEAPPIPVLVASEPVADGTLPKTQNNVILLTFGGPTALPGGAALSVVPIAGGSDVGGSLTYSIEPDGVTLKAKENGNVLTKDPATWYRVTPVTGLDVQPFTLDVCTLLGDANGSARVTTADYSEVKAHMAEYTDARYDLNGSGRVTTADYSVVKSNMADRAPIKP